MSAPDTLYAFCLPGGGQFDYPLSSAIGKNLFAGWFEPAEVDFVRRHLKPGDVVLDLGANAGLYTLLAARAVGPAGHVYAFEPGARALELLRHNVQINGATNVTIIDAAVSDKTGTASFAVARDTAYSSLADIDRDDQDVVEWKTVRTIRLDDAISEYGIPQATFIKMDVEGAEKLALDGASRLLARSTPLTILFEASDTNASAFGYTVSELLLTLRALGFSLSGFDRELNLRPVESLGTDVGGSVSNIVARRA